MLHVPNETCDLNTGYETVRMTVQPTSKMAFKGDWGRCPNKQFLKIEPAAKLKKMSEPVQVYTACQFVCIRIVPRKFRNIDKYIK